jgi:hypothetical protein
MKHWFDNQKFYFYFPPLNGKESASLRLGAVQDYDCNQFNLIIMIILSLTMYSEYLEYSFYNYDMITITI